MGEGGGGGGGTFPRMHYAPVISSHGPYVAGGRGTAGLLTFQF